MKSQPQAPRRWRPALVKWLLLVVAATAAVGIDVVTKRWAEQNLALGESRRIVSFFYFERTANNGVAFGLLGGHTATIVAANTIAFLLVVAFVFWWRRPVLAGLSGGLIIGGFVGNLVQRVRGENIVTDFLKFPHWPNFNMADVFLILGICVIVLGLVLDMVVLQRAAKGGES